MSGKWAAWQQWLALGAVVAALGCGDDGSGSGPGPGDTDSGTSDGTVDDSGSGDTGPAPDVQSDSAEPDGEVPDTALDAGELGDAGDAGQDVGEDTGGEGPADPSLQLWHAHSSDGTAVWVEFDAPLDSTSAADPANYTIASEAGATRTVTAAAVDSRHAALTLDAALDPAATWTLRVENVRAESGLELSGPATTVIKGTVHLNLVWHQHQPSYLDPAKDELQGPWVRKHAQKSYFDMTAAVEKFPNLHFNVNLTSSLLTQLALYIERLEPFVDVEANSVDEAAFLSANQGKTDPWIDLLLTDTPAPNEATEAQIERYYGGIWTTKSIAEPLRAFFPEYDALVKKSPESYTQLDLAHLKLWFELAWMDPDFLTGSVVVYSEGDEEIAVDLSDVVVRSADGKFTLAPQFTLAGGSEAAALAECELLANRLVAEELKIMKGVLDIHRRLGYANGAGQVEVLTTPFFHPILPLLFDTDLAKEGQPADPVPNPAFSYPEDATLQIAAAVQFYERLFERTPRGMWPSEGAVAEEVLPALAQNGIEWIATDRQVLERGFPGKSHFEAYRVDADTVVGSGGSTDDELMIVFRDTELSDKVGFAYQSNEAQANATDFVRSVHAKAAPFGQPVRLLSVILDGENAWEWYTKDHDAKQFLTLTYQGLSAAHERASIVTVTGSEYIDGNPARGVPAHPLSTFVEYEDLFPGSWIGGRLDTWIGETEENLAWVYLRTAREALESAAVTLAAVAPKPTNLLDAPDTDDAVSLPWWRAWRAIYSAEGSDWFWWYGADQTAAGGNDSPFDTIFRAQLTSAYTFANEALVAAGEAPLEVPAFPPILQPPPQPLSGPYGAAPTLDGLLTPDESEWTPPGGLQFDNDTSGAIDDPDDDIARVFFGYSNLSGGLVYLGLDFKEDLSAKLGTNFQVAIYTNHGNIENTDDGNVLIADPFNTNTEEGLVADLDSGGAARQILLDFAGAAVELSLANATGSGGWTPADATAIEFAGPAAGGSLLELKVPLSALGMKKGSPFEFIVVAREGNSATDRAPNLGSITVFADVTKLVEVVFELDATGSQIPLSEYVSIQNPPPPLGEGAASIVGNQTVFGNWTPNSVFMSDDGVAPDAVANDNIWTIGFPFPPGTDLQYKYTVGVTGASWGGTEEYPLTNRAYTVPTDGTQGVRLRDIFADRPDPSGTMAKLTTVTPFNP